MQDGQTRWSVGPIYSIHNRKLLSNFTIREHLAVVRPAQPIDFRELPTHPLRPRHASSHAHSSTMGLRSSTSVPAEHFTVYYKSSSSAHSGILPRGNGDLSLLTPFLSALAVVSVYTAACDNELLKSSMLLGLVKSCNVLACLCDIAASISKSRWGQEVHAPLRQAVQHGMTHYYETGKTTKVPAKLMLTCCRIS